MPAHNLDQPRHDHRKLGRALGLFDTDPLIGAGLPYLLPAGAAVRHELEEYVRELERKVGYQHVYSPVLGKRELYEISGHWEHYRDGMYPPMTVDPAGGADQRSEQVVLRPSLCPHHAVIYRSRAHSYRELPLRMAEIGGMYRAELSGVLGGLTRVRAIQLNDAHIFCTLDQVAAEAAAALAMIREAYCALGLASARYRLSLGGPSAKYVGSPGMWDRAEGILRGVLDQAGLAYDAEEGEAAFYGPKIDVQVTDSAERETSLSTVQVDFYQPDRFALEYIGPDNNRHRPVMVHRSVIGSLDRMLAHLIDTHGGAFPPWLAPTQLAVLPVSAGQRPAAQSFVTKAIEAGLRAELDTEGSLAVRIRRHHVVPYQAILGNDEVASGEVSLRLRDGRQLASRRTDEAISHIARLVSSRSPRLWSEPEAV